MATDETPSSARTASTTLRIAGGVLALVVLLYSVVVGARPLLGVAVVVWLFGLYLLWRFLLLASRFVRAVERIADEMARSENEDAGSPSHGDSASK